MQLQKDIIFHNWKVKNRIGAGNSGTVYEIERQEFGRTYRAAAKVMFIPKEPGEIQELLREGMTEENVRAYYRSIVENIISECDLMERMKGDSHIVSYEDHYVERSNNGMQWTIYIRMELLKPLSELVTDGENPLRTDEVIRLGMDICKGLATCQKFHVVHRDIKLENIFLSDTGHYKLGDFGISKVMKQRIDRTVVPKGTRLYMAPEILRGEEYDATVDIYSLGLVLFRLLNNNRAPFLPPYPETIRVSDKEIALRRRLSGEEIPMPCNADEYFGTIIRKACSFRPEDRYQTPEEMLSKLAGLEKNKDRMYTKQCMEEAPVSDTVVKSENVSATYNVWEGMGSHSLDLKQKGRTACRDRKKHRNVGRRTAVFAGVVLMVLTGGYLVLHTALLITAENAASLEYSQPDIILHVGNLCEDITKAGQLAVERYLEEYWLYVPKVSGFTEKEAVECLLEAGYEKENIKVVYEYSREAEHGMVFSQNAEEGSMVKKTSSISISVSLGGKPADALPKSTVEEKDSGWIWKAID